MGGEIRWVNSLSGGESFLVSLALALGVVMNALDALQSMGRKVGVISNVHEMTERIAAKIQVRPNGGGSSAISVGV